MFIDSVALLLSDSVALLLVLGVVHRAALLAVLGGADGLGESLTDVLIHRVTLLSGGGAGHQLIITLEDPTTLLPALVLIDSGALLLLDSAALLLVHRAAAGPVIAHGVGGRDGRNPEVHEGVAEVCSITEPA